MKIPTYGGGGGARGTPLPSSASSYSPLADALEEATTQLNRRRDAVMAEQARTRHAREALWVTETTAAAQRDWTQRYSQAIDGVETGAAAGFAERFNQGFEDWQAPLLANAPSEEARIAAQQRLIGLQSSFYQQAASFERQSIYGENQQRFTGAFDSLTGAVAAGADPMQTLARFQSDLSLADGQWMEGPEVEEWSRKAPGAIAAAYVGGLVERDPSAALVKLGAPAVAARLAGPPGGDLIGAVIQAESAGDPSAVSPAGAVGLMQVLPSTAREVLASLGDRELARLPEPQLVALLKDPEENRRIGEAYLAQMLARYQGNAAMALAAYNAGPGKVDEWTASIGDPRGGDLTTEEWIAAIPFDETRGYVGTILGSPVPHAATPEGRPIVQNPDGSVSTERTITVEVDGKWVNIPTMFGGKQVSHTAAVQIMQKNKWVDPETGRPMTFFVSLDAAEKSAVERSAGLGAMIQDPMIAALSPADREKAIAAAERKLTERQSTLAMQLAPRLKDEEAAAAAGETIANPVRLEELVSAYGPADGLKAWGELETVRAVGRDLAQVALKTPAEQQALLERWAPAGDGFAGEAARYGVMAQAIAQDQKAREDPAAYVYRVSPELRALYEDPARAGEALTMSLALQQRAGIPEADRRALSTDQAASIAEEITRSDAAQILQTIDGLAQTYGDHWGQVAGELVESGLPAPALALVTLDNDPLWRRAVAQGLEAGGEAVLKGTLSKEALDTINEDLLAALEPWTVTMPQGAAQPYIDAARLAALSFAKHMDPSAAAARGAAAITSRYEFAGDYRIPVMFDPARVERGLDRFIENLSEIDMSGGDPNLAPEDRVAAGLSAIRGEHHWMTNENESGVVLLDQHWGLVTRNGLRIEVSFADAAAEPGPPLGWRRGSGIATP